MTGTFVQTRSCEPLPTRRHFLGRLAAGLAAVSVGNAVAGRAWSAPGRGPVVATGPTDPRLEGFDRLMNQFLTEHPLAGAAVAVTKGGKLVYARGFGHANVEGHTPVRPNSLFRIASVSKTFTAVAVMQLVERKQLRLEDKVFDVLPLAPKLRRGARFDPRLKEITVLQLLQHTGGWDRAKSGDPLPRDLMAERGFDRHAAREDEMVRWKLGLPLDFDPGTRFAYSNFGYTLLGRVVARVTRQPYHAYVQKEVLAPLGIRDMRVGTKEYGRPHPGEVTYYDHRRRTTVALAGVNKGKRVPLGYDGTWLPDHVASAGRWVASAVDLARFASAFEGPERCPLLAPETVRRMWARPEGPAGQDERGRPRQTYYGCGWHVAVFGGGRRSCHHFGRFQASTSALMYRHPDGLTWSALFNSCFEFGAKGGAPKKELAQLLHPLLKQAAAEVKSWPDTDLFGEYL